MAGVAMEFFRRADAGKKHVPNLRVSRRCNGLTQPGILTPTPTGLPVMPGMMLAANSCAASSAVTPAFLASRLA